MPFIALAAIPRQRTLRLPLSTQPLRTQPRSPQEHLALLRLATPPRTTRVVLQGLREPLRLRTTQVAVLLALQLRVTQLPTTLVEPQALREAPPPVGLRLTERHVEHLAEQPKRLVGLQVGLLIGVAPQGNRLQVNTMAVRPRFTQALTITGLSAAIAIGRVATFSHLVLQTPLRQQEDGLITVVRTGTRTTGLITAFIEPQAPLIHVAHLAAQAVALLRRLVGQRTLIRHAELLDRLLLRLTRQLLLEHLAALLKAPPPVGQQHTVQVEAQRHRSTLQLRLEHRMEQATARLQRLTPTLRAPLAMQQALVGRQRQVKTL